MRLDTFGNLQVFDRGISGACVLERAHIGVSLHYNHPLARAAPAELLPGRCVGEACDSRIVFAIMPQPSRPIGCSGEAWSCSGS